MSFRISLTGMNAALAELGVRSNNIANSSTMGFKKSTAHFASLVADSVADGPSNATGRGAILQGNTANFSQGGLTTTGNALDLALEGDGFFIVQTNEASPADPKRFLDGYTRNGSFRVNADGYLVDTSGRRLKTDANTTSEQGLVRIPTSVGLPRASSNIGLDVNLPSDATVKPITAEIPFDPADTSSFNLSTSVQLYDSVGRTHTAGIYFRKTALATPDAPANKWNTYVLVDGKQLEPQQSNALSFDTAGRLQSPLGPLKFKPLALDNAGEKVDPLVLSLDLSKGTSQFSSGYSVRSVSQDGYGPGLIQQLSVDNAGVLKLALTNGRSVDLATIRTARFRNPAGLKPDGDGIFLATSDSGKPEVGNAGQGGFGAMQSGALERSNVELTDELIALVATQRNFSANAKAIQAVSDMEKNLADQA